jgi:hypothetical protein
MHKLPRLSGISAHNGHAPRGRRGGVSFALRPRASRPRSGACALAGAVIPLLCTVSVLSAMPVDLSGLRPGPVAVRETEGILSVNWPDEKGRVWSIGFRTDGKPEVIRAIALGDKTILENGQPVYFADTGIRRGGWDQFFDFPPSHPEGIRRFQQAFKPAAVKARTVGDRVEVEFDGLSLGIFSCSLVYTIYPGSRLIQQEAVLSTTNKDVAYFYDAGLDYQPAADRRPGNNMETYVTYYDPGSPDLHTMRTPVASERDPIEVRYRAIAARLAGGSIALFPPPHQYFFARDYTSNMGYCWHRTWRGHAGLGIRQLPDDNSPYYPWMNAPPGTVQRMSLFFLISDAPPAAALSDVLAFTRRDHYIPLAGFRTVAPHWHFAFTEQAVAGGSKWIPPWQPVLRDMGVNAALIMDFHGDLHPQDPGPLRFAEMRQYYDMCRRHSTSDFLIIPGEEADVYFGGHWALAFPKPVIWAMKRVSGEWKSTDPVYGTVYRVNDAPELLRLVREQNAFVYETHPRTKGSTGYPDKILDTEWFQDAHYLGAGWKAMPSDLSSPRLGERAFKVADDLANKGFHKKFFGEVDVFQLDNTHELYAHMNVNYVRLHDLPAWDDYGKVLDALAKADGFITTGEILLPAVEWKPGADRLTVSADVQWTFPLRLAEIVWGDGAETHRQIVDLSGSRQMGTQRFDWTLDATAWKWARLAVWDVAGDGAFTNAVWK